MILMAFQMTYGQTDNIKIRNAGLLKQAMKEAAN
jgi:hypothetical protein